MRNPVLLSHTESVPACVRRVTAAVPGYVDFIPDCQMFGAFLSFETSSLGRHFEEKGAFSSL